MISIELIFPLQDKKLYARVSESISVGEFRKNIMDSMGIKNGRIFMLTSEENVTDDMTLSEAGMHSGSGVIIDHE